MPLCLVKGHRGVLEQKLDTSTYCVISPSTKNNNKIMQAILNVLDSEQTMTKSSVHDINKKMNESIAWNIIDSKPLNGQESKWGLAS